MILFEVSNLTKEDVASLHALEGGRNGESFFIGEAGFGPGSLRFNRLCAGLEYGRGYCGYLELQQVSSEMIDLIDFSELPGIRDEEHDGDVHATLDA